MTDDLAGISVSEALALFRSRKLSPVELMQSLIERAEKTEPVVNALSDRHDEQALHAAREAEKAYASRSGEPRALEGIPFSVKASVAVGGQKLTSGSLIYKDRVAAESEPTVDRLREAGGIFHAQNTSPEFSWAWVTYSRLYGVTRNPWNSEITPGGSCGGSAAAVASGTTLLSIGADSAGSIRMPSAMCGVVGYKP
ncbi:MAG: amidase, partial [Gemmatimonadetes bacterium]|nr:amidase [Gemmatimonadota bacterium]